AGVSATTAAAQPIAPPTISAFSPDSNVSGDGITNANVVTLTGSAAANSSIKVFDGTTQIGTVTANASGVWSFATPTLANGAHSFTAKATDAAGNTSAASAPQTLAEGTVAPHAPSSTTLCPDTSTVG